MKQTVTDGQRCTRCMVADRQAGRQADVQVCRRTESRQAKGTRGLTYCQVDIQCIQIDIRNKYIIICISIFHVDESSV